MTVDEYVSRSLSRQWDWRTVNCAFWAADWVVEATGVDPATKWRRWVKGRRTARVQVATSGGLLRVATKAMAACGFAETDQPKDGDVAIVLAPVPGEAPGTGVVGHVSSIRCGGMWVVRSEGSVLGGDLPLVKAWRV